jgi:hypothetical protein
MPRLPTTHGSAPFQSCVHRERPGLPLLSLRRGLPRTKGKAERFIQAALREWAYAHTYQNSSQCSQQLSCWLHLYNWHRPHAGLGFTAPICRSNLNRNNLLCLHTFEFPPLCCAEMRRYSGCSMDWLPPPAFNKVRCVRRYGASAPAPHV